MKRAVPALLVLAVGCQDRLPAWSRDGKSVAFICGTGSRAEESELYVVTLGKDESPRPVARSASLPSWAEDGSLYYLQSTGAGDVTLAKLRPDGEREVVLDPPGYELKWYALVEKGVYCILDPGGKLLYYDAAKGELLQVSSAERCAWACLHPDGRSLAVCVEREKGAEVLLLADGEEKSLGKLEPEGQPPAMTFFEGGVLAAVKGGMRCLPLSGKGARLHKAPEGKRVIALGLSPAGEALVSVNTEGKDDVVLYAFSKRKWSKLGESWGRTYNPGGGLFAEYTKAGLHVAPSDLSDHAYYPVTPEEELAAVLAYEESGSLAAALSQAERALSRPSGHSARMELARMRIHLRLKDPRQAARDFLRAYLVHPVSDVKDGEWDAAFKRVSALTDRLIEDLSSARRLTPSMAAETLDRAQALEADPDMLAGLAFRTGLCLFRARRNVDAARRFRTAWDVESFPQRAHAAMMQAVSYYFAGKTALAAETLARASATLPETRLSPLFDRLRVHLLREGGRSKWTVEAKGSAYSARVVAGPELELDPERVWVSFKRTSTVLKDDHPFLGPLEGEVGRLAVSPDGKALGFLKRSGGEEAWEEACVVSARGKTLVEEKREGILDCSWKGARKFVLILAEGEEAALEVPSED